MSTTNVFVILLIGLVHLDGFQSAPPSPWQPALMARYIIRNSNWVSIATKSTQTAIKDYPFVSVKSMSDGIGTNSTGMPYLYMTDMDVSGQDVKVDNRCTILATLAESDYCKTKDFDPQDPRCAKVIITGNLIKIDQSSPEYQYGLNALFSRHPSMKWWPKNHEFYVAKIDIKQIVVLDFFGGLKHVSIKDYFNANGVRSWMNGIFYERIEIFELRD